MELLIAPFAILFGLAVALFGIAAFVFWIWTLIDCLKNEPSEGNSKIVWAIVILILHGLGALLYFLIRRPDRIRETGR